MGKKDRALPFTCLKCGASFWREPPVEIRLCPDCASGGNTTILASLGCLAALAFPPVAAWLLMAYKGWSFWPAVGASLAGLAAVGVAWWLLGSFYEFLTGYRWDEGSRLGDAFSLLVFLALLSGAIVAGWQHL